MSYVSWFADVGLRDRPDVGGKGGSLGEMQRAGIPVPPGFVVTTAAFERFLEAIEADSPAGVTARRETGAYLARFGPEFDSLGVQLGARYDDSPIIVPDGSGPPVDDPDVYAPNACPGGRAPHVWLTPGASLFDRLGRGFTLLDLSRGTRRTNAFTEAAGTRRLPLTVVTLDQPEARDLYERDLVLIRPDQHVAWRGNAAPADCAALFARVTGG